MQALLDIILPVFLVVGFGYLIAWRGLLSAASIDGLMSFTQNVAIPCLLFRAIWTLDLGDSFSLPLLISFYSGSLTCFFVGLFGAHYLFKRDWEDAVAIGFTCLFANSVLLGLAITERAFGPDALSANYAIIALHSPICYGLGITTMEFVRARAAGQPNRNLPVTVAKAMFRNALVVGIALGAVFNLFNVTLPAPFTDALDMMVRTALPAALFAMGGVLFRYRPEGDMRIIFVHMLHQPSTASINHVDPWNSVRSGRQRVPQRCTDCCDGAGCKLLCVCKHLWLRAQGGCVLCPDGKCAFGDYRMVLAGHSSVEISQNLKAL